MPVLGALLQPSFWNHNQGKNLVEICHVFKTSLRLQRHVSYRRANLKVACVHCDGLSCSPFPISRVKTVSSYFLLDTFDIIYLQCILIELLQDSVFTPSEICGLLGNYTASCGNYLPTFWDNMSVPSSRVKIPSRKESLLTKKLDSIAGWGNVRCDASQ
jgi:hypothetical protein